MIEENKKNKMKLKLADGDNKILYINVLVIVSSLLLVKIFAYSIEHNKQC